MYKYRSVDAVLAVSNWIKTQLVRAGLRQDRVFVAESGTDFSRFQKSLPGAEARNMLDIPPQAFVIGNVGSIETQKGQLFLLQAFSQLVCRNPSIPYHLIFVGGGSGLEECRSFVHRLNISDQVLFAGFHSDIENYYAAMDVLFLSTIPAMGEGWSGAIREAMAAGVPVIAVRQESILEQIQNGETGLLVDFNGLEEWIAAIENLQQNRDLRLSLIEKARNHIQQFTVESMTDKTEECYRNVLGRDSLYGR
jgi:glycosyltransferase involved in cell wall biosynthesis